MLLHVTWSWQLFISWLFQKSNHLVLFHFRSGLGNEGLYSDGSQPWQHVWHCVQRHLSDLGRLRSSAWGVHFTFHLSDSVQSIPKNFCQFSPKVFLKWIFSEVYLKMVITYVNPEICRLPSLRFHDCLLLKQADVLLCKKNKTFVSLSLHLKTVLKKQRFELGLQSP